MGVGGCFDRGIKVEDTAYARAAHPLEGAESSSELQGAAQRSRRAKPDHAGCDGRPTDLGARLVQAQHRVRFAG